MRRRSEMKSGVTKTDTAAACAAAISEKARSKSSALRASAIRRRTPSSPADSSTSLSRACLARSGIASGFSRTAMRAAPGTASFSISSRLPASCGEKKDKPVMLPPGRARLAARPSCTGSPTAAKTIGIVVVARFAASAASVPPAVTMISTLRATSSAARAGNRSSLSSAQRYSIATFRPSTYPFSLNPRRKTSTNDRRDSGVPILR